MQICTHTADGLPKRAACWSNFCQAAEFGSVQDCTTRPPVPYGPHMRLPPSATYPWATFSAIEQPMKPIEFAGPAVGPTVGGEVVGVVLPVQVTPLRANDAGAGLAVVKEPLKPKLTAALVATPPFQDRLRAVTCEPDWLTLACQAWVTCWPAVYDQVSVQPVTGSPRLVRLTVAPKPPDHCELTV